ncbi:hypothetical protein LCGC14_1960350, partial [marine sediment metagenome]
ASTSLQFSHAGGTKLIFSNSPNLYDQAAFKGNDETVTGTWTYTSTAIPIFDANPTITDDKHFATKKYVDDVAIAGAPDATLSVKGILEVGTQIEMASTTAIGGGDTTAPLALTTAFSTSTPDGTSQAGLFAVISKNNGKLHQLWLDLTEAFTWTGHHIFSSFFATNASTTNATTTNQHITGVTSTILKTDSSGRVLGATAGVDYVTQQYTFATTTNTSVAGDSTATSTFLGIPASTITASSSIEARIQATCTDGGTDGVCSFSVRDSAGTILSQCNLTSSASYNAVIIDFKIFSDNSDSSQIAICNGRGTTATAIALTAGENTSSFDMSNAFNLSVVVSVTQQASLTLSNYSIIVQP